MSLLVAVMPTPIGAEGEVIATYNFDADALGQQPSGVQTISGKVEVVDDLLLGRSLRATRADGVSKLAVASFEQVLATDMSVVWRESSLLVSGSRHGFMLRTNGVLSGYLFQINTLTGDATQNTARLFRLTDGAAPVLLRSVSYVATPDRWFKASAKGTSLTLGVSDGPSSFTQILSANDVAAPHLSGGLFYTAGWGGMDPASNTVDDIGVSYTPANGLINLTTPSSFQVVQRRADGTADISVTGTYRGAPTAIEARWGDGAWSVLDPAPVDGTFSGVLVNRPTGQHNLEVRFANEITVARGREAVSVGDVFIVAGQSNAVGKGYLSQTAAPHPTLRPAMFGNDDRWKGLSDPLDSPVGQTDSVSRDSVAGGTVWPIVAGKAMADLNVPVAFVPTAKKGTSITAWQRNDSTPNSRTTLYGNMGSKIRAAGGAKAVLFWQGETDAYQNMPAATYESLLDAFADDVLTDFGVPVVAAQIGDVLGSASASLDGVRLAQRRLWDSGGSLIAGPSLYDIDLEDDRGDGVHFMTSTDIATAADRWWGAILQTVYGLGDGRGPRLASSTLNAARTEITVQFADASLPLDPAAAGGFTVKAVGVALTTLGVTRSLIDTYVIRLAAPAPLGTLTVSLGEGRSGTGKPVPLDGSIAHHPAEVFVDAPVS